MEIRVWYDHSSIKFEIANTSTPEECRINEGPNDNGWSSHMIIMRKSLLK